MDATARERAEDFVAALALRLGVPPGVLLNVGAMELIEDFVERLLAAHTNPAENIPRNIPAPTNVSGVFRAPAPRRPIGLPDGEWDDVTPVARPDPIWRRLR